MISNLWKYSFAIISKDWGKWGMKNLSRLLFISLVAISFSTRAADLLARENLYAWCIVPFDAKKRGPEERAEMLQKLGFKQFAYDWRAEHIPTFDAECEAMKKHKIEIMAWWFPQTMNGDAQKILDCIARQKIHPQLWVMGGNPDGANDAEKVEKETARIKPIAEAAAKLGCKVGLYNHGGWFGWPENQIDIIKRLARDGVKNVGIVYSFHHAHEDLARYGEIIARTKPYLLAVSINGMVRDGDRLGKGSIPVGSGDYELEMIRFLEASGWRGPIGIISEHAEADAEVTLANNLRGLEWIRAELKMPGSGGANPFATAKESSDNKGAFGNALDADQEGKTFDGREEFRSLPLTIECWVKLRNANGFNIFAAHDQKSSCNHWELYSYSGDGDLSVYLPGRGGEFRSGVKVCDNQWHHVATQIETNRVRIYLDGKVVLDKPAQPLRGSPVNGPLVIGHLIEGHHGCDGWIDDVRISRGVRPVVLPKAPLAKDEFTLGLWNFDNELPSAKPPPVAPFFFANEPLDPDAWPNRTAYVNRDRLYDFYTKEALAFAGKEPLPKLLPNYPGLDGGRFGHWGNQNEETWRSTKWNDMDQGNLLGCVFRQSGKTIPRAMLVHLGGPEKFSVCFDEDTMSWPFAWKGGFISHSNVRNGFMEGGKPIGEMIEPPASEPLEKGSFVYHGFYRHGDSVVFAFAKDGVEWLESARAENGRIVRLRCKADDQQLAKLTHGGPAQWPQLIETKGELGKAEPYTLDTLTIPANTPWKSSLNFCGLDFFANGDALVSTFEGEVWLVRGIDDSLRHLRWKRFAAGLHQPLGLLIENDKIFAVCRDGVYRLHDLNGDDEADFFECVSRPYEPTTGGHDYVMGLERDAQGRFYIVSGKQGIFRTTPDQTNIEILATGFRNPNGIALGPHGEVIAGANEGEWTPTSWITEIIPGAHYGYRGPQPGPLGNVPPTLYIPRGADNSCGGQHFIKGDRWGVPSGSLVHLSYGAGTAFIALRETLEGIPQGCAIPLPGDFRSGLTKARTNPRDGQLYCVGTAGWGTYTPDDGCFQRLRYTGGKSQLPLAFHSHGNGIRIEFPKPLPREAGDAKRWFAQAWNYRMTAAYGSEEYSLQWPNVAGHDALPVKSVHLADDRRSLFVEIPDIAPCNQLHLFANIDGLVSRSMYFTLHHLGGDYTNFAGYAPHAHRAVAQQPFVIPAEKLAPVKWETGAPGRAILIQSAPGLQFAQKELRAKAGERISLTFENPDVMPHNFVLAKIGSEMRIGELSNLLVTKPEAISMSYVPESPDILVHTRLVNPDTSTTIHFNAPDKPGDYPYMCTFPGHWMVMKGVLRVE